METAKTKNVNYRKIGFFCLTHVTEIVLVVVIIALWLANPNFMRISNWMNLLRSGAIKGIIALGVTMVLIAGKIDLSLGSQVALSGVIVAVFGKNMTAAGWSDLTVPCLIGMGVSLVVGVCCGGFHAFIQNKYNIPPFIITLAMQYVLFGLGATICNNYPIPNMYPDWFVQMGMAVDNAGEHQFARGVNDLGGLGLRALCQKGSILAVFDGNVRFVNPVRRNVFAVFDQKIIHGIIPPSKSFCWCGQPILT